MLLLQVIFLAPQSAAQLLSFVMVTFLARDTPDGGAVTRGFGVVPKFFTSIPIEGELTNGPA